MNHSSSDQVVEQAIRLLDSVPNHKLVQVFLKAEQLIEVRVRDLASQSEPVWSKPNEWFKVYHRWSCYEDDLDYHEESEVFFRYCRPYGAKRYRGHEVLLGLASEEPGRDQCCRECLKRAQSEAKPRSVSMVEELLRVVEKGHESNVLL